MRVNWLAIIIATIALFLFGYLWYGVLFTAIWTAEMHKINPQFAGSTSIYPFVISLTMGFFSAYAIARYLSRGGEQTIARGAFVGLSLGLLVFGSMTWMDYAFSNFGMTLGWINIGYVVVGMAIQGAIIGAWKLKA